MIRAILSTRNPFAVRRSERDIAVVRQRRLVEERSTCLVLREHTRWRWGPTDSFTSVNASVGVRFGDTTTLSVSAYNLFDEDVQQHVFGDLISRRVVGRLLFRF